MKNQFLIIGVIVIGIMLLGASCSGPMADVETTCVDYIDERDYYEEKLDKCEDATRYMEDLLTECQDELEWCEFELEDVRMSYDNLYSCVDDCVWYEDIDDCEWCL